MGIYLHPISQRMADMEWFAKVPKYTGLEYKKRMTSVPPQRFMEAAKGDRDQARFFWLQENEMVSRLEHFLLNGYGKFDYSWIGDEVVGEITDSEIAETLFKTATNHEFFRLDPNGVCWY